MIHIVCEDGRLQHVRVFDDETGLDISKHLTNIEIHANLINNCFEAVLTIYKPHFDIKTLRNLLSIDQRDEHKPTT